MVLTKRMLFSVLAVTSLISTGKAFPDPREPARHVLNAARSLWKRDIPPSPGYVHPTTPPDLLNGAKPAKLETIDHQLAPDRKIKSCQDGSLGFGNSHRDSNYHEICSYPLPAANQNVDTGTIIENLNNQHSSSAADKGKFIARSKLERGKVELIQGWPEEAIEWSQNPGKMIDNKDACQLCTSIHDNYKIPKGYLAKDGTHQCVCKKWAKGYEKFMACNCNLCDAWLIPWGLRNQCWNMAVKNKNEGYLSRYVALQSHNAFVRLYNDKHKTGIAMDFALGDIQKGITVCRSGVQGKEYETKGGMLWGETKSPGKACPAAFKDALN
jgi:hypothetical protein